MIIPATPVQVLACNAHLPAAAQCARLLLSQTPSVTLAPHAVPVVKLASVQAAIA